jgi:hypothetical protein
MEEKLDLIVLKPLNAGEIKAQTKISKDFYSIFSNHVRIAASLTEFRIFFGENYPTAIGGIEVIEHLSVVLTTEQAKNLLSNLSVVIQKQEEFNRPQTLPKGPEK